MIARPDGRQHAHQRGQHERRQPGRHPERVMGFPPVPGGHTTYRQPHTTRMGVRPTTSRPTSIPALVTLSTSMTVQAQAGTPGPPGGGAGSRGLGTHVTGFRQDHTIIAAALSAGVRMANSLARSASFSVAERGPPVHTQVRP